MKKYTKFIPIIGMLFIGTVVFASANAVHVSSRNGTDTGDVTTDLVPSASERQFLVTDPSSKLPELWGVDSQLTFNETTHRLTVGTIDQHQVASLAEDISALYASTSALTSLTADKASNSSVTSVSNRVATLEDKFGSTTIQSVRVQTNGSGTYTWTFPVAFGTSTIPVISATPEDSTSAASTDVRIVSVSNTAVTVQASRLTSVLGLLTLNATPQIFVHLQAISQ